MHLMLDTDVVVAAVRSDAGASRRLLVAALERRYVLLLSVPLIIEYEAVLTRAEHLAAAGLSVAEVMVILDALVADAEPVRLSFLWRPQLRDPADDMVLETALNGPAEWLVTFNRRHFGPAAERFTLEVVSPGDALQRLRSHEKE